MNNAPNPRFSTTELQVRLTHDDAGVLLLLIESLGYFAVPPAIEAAVKAMRCHMPETRISEMSARFILAAMLNNQAT